MSLVQRILERLGWRERQLLRGCDLHRFARRRIATFALRRVLSGRNDPLPGRSSLRTVHASFPAYSSSLR